MHRRRKQPRGLLFITLAIAIFVFITSFVVQKYRTFGISFAAGLIGDVDGNGIVNIIDIGLIIDNYAKNPPPNPNTDINKDGIVNIIDIGLTIDHYGEISSTPVPTPSGLLTYNQINSAIDAYKAAHPGNGGKDWDINAKTDAQLAADPAAAQLVSLCGSGQRPVIPKIAWEYGGTDHPWINPSASALIYCVYIPVSQQTTHWKYDATADRVTADVYVKFPDNNPCKNMVGKDQVISCLGDPTNSEILVDTASLNDGAKAGYSLLNSTTILNLILPDGSSVFLLTNI